MEIPLGESKNSFKSEFRNEKKKWGKIFGRISRSLEPQSWWFIQRFEINSLGKEVEMTITGKWFGFTVWIRSNISEFVTQNNIFELANYSRKLLTKTNRQLFSFTISDYSNFFSFTKFIKQTKVLSQDLISLVFNRSNSLRIISM